MSWGQTLAIAMGAASVVACLEQADVDSTSIRTSGMYTDILFLDADGASTEVIVDLQVGAGDRATVINLRGDDELVATAGGDAQYLSGSDGNYRATFPGNHEAESLNLAFYRGSEDESAPSSPVTMPRGFVLEGDAEVSRSGAGRFTWTPSGTGDPMHWELRGDCLETRSGEMGDPGVLDLTASHHRPRSGQEEATCRATLSVERWETGTVDPAYGEGGSVRAIQRRTFRFDSVP